MSEQAFEVLEDRVRKAAELVRRLRVENGQLADERGRLEAQLEQAEARRRTAEEGLERLTAAGADAGRLGEELAALKKDREEVRRRVAKLLEVLEALD